MTGRANSVAITGIGIVTSLGVGRAAHQAILTAGTAPKPIVDEARFAPYPVHPLPEIDWSEQIPRRSDQRQMDSWQRLGVFTAGLALEDAGLKDDAEACATMDMIVAAGGGERDQAVDTEIVDAAADVDERETLLNRKLMSELRPTLFLAQLSNLLAGNISIVHKVTGSSRTFMGEEGAGISALETAVARIRAGQSIHALVGASHIAERPDMHFVFEGANALAQGGWLPLTQREGKPGGGIVLGSAAAFLVLEARDRAQARGATIHALIDHIAGDRGPRQGLESRLSAMADGRDADLVLSGASGFAGLTASEAAFLDVRYPDAAKRRFANFTGHALEAQFPLGIALAAMAIGAGRMPPAFAEDGETDAGCAPERALVTTLGYERGEGMAYLTKAGGRDVPLP